MKEKKKKNLPHSSATVYGQRRVFNFNGGLELVANMKSLKMIWLQFNKKALQSKKYSKWLTKRSRKKKIKSICFLILNQYIKENSNTCSAVLDS